MLAKLLKHEWKSTYRLLVITHGAMLVSALLGRIIFTLAVSTEVPVTLAAGGAYVILFFFGIIGVSTATTICLLMRFYRNLFTDEGYLMHTLPVGAGHLIWSKFIIFYFWCLLDTVILIGCLSLFFLTPRSTPVVIDVLNKCYTLLLAELGGSEIKSTLYIVLCIPLATAEQILLMYFSITLGSLMTKHKVLGAVGCYLAIMAATFTLNMVIVLIFCGNYFDVVLKASQSGSYPVFLGLKNTFYFSLLQPVILGAIFYKATHYIITKHLNLE